ncbi:MAG TPA: exo-alpha-sialidase [Clostridiaceae bacterium]|nr:exo-alpha-sialidase [Clostridiaceae bacterium]
MGIKIKETIDSYLSYKDYYILGPSIAYCPNTKAKGYRDMLLMADLFNASDSNTGTMLWRSTDGGKTWTIQDYIEKSYVYDFNNSWVKSGYGAIYSDEKTGVMIFLANDTYWENNKIQSLWKKRTLYYRLSFDNGYTWTNKKYIIQKGKDPFGQTYDKIHFLKDVYFGRNMAASVSPLIIKTYDGSILVSVQVQITNEKGELINPTGWGYMKAGAIKGSWNEENLDYEWDLGEYASVSLNESTRGVYEPAFGKIRDNKLIMVMRGSNASRRDEIMGVKFYSTSKDNGYTWSKPLPLKYDDDTVMYSSSCIPKLINHTNGRLYYIGVINDSNPDGNLPRYPLCIAEIDMENCCVIKDSVTVIDTKRKNQDDSAKDSHVVDFSNHGIYEDKNTGDIIVFAPFRPNLKNYACVLNKYVISVS